MTLSESLLPELEQEMANLRKTLERIPDEKLDWTPHAKSMSFRGLATHLSNMPRWATMTIQEESFDMAPEGGEPVTEEPVDSVADALAQLDENVAAARTALEGTSDEELLESWALLMGGQEVFKMPRIAVLRSMIMNHMIHHRGQLTVYLRLNDVPLPALYGPSADEGG
jgi:uncharacterized damage-inducible protein DinB